jgi:hypothetical protein
MSYDDYLKEYDLELEEDNDLIDLTKKDSETLVNMIAANMFIQISDQLKIECMQELANRRINGDNFKFEDAIKEKSSQFKKITRVNLPTILTSIGKNNANKRNM